MIAETVSREFGLGSCNWYLCPPKYFSTAQGPTNFGDTLELLSRTCIMTESPMLNVLGEAYLCGWSHIVALVACSLPLRYVCEKLELKLHKIIIIMNKCMSTTQQIIRLFHFHPSNQEVRILTC